MPTAPAWLLEGSPIAHRGLHDDVNPENSAGAIRAAVSRGFPIEFDLQLTGDGKLVVFHDRNAKRMTGQNINVTSHSLSRLQSRPLLGTHEPAPSLGEALSIVSGKVPLVIEVKPAKLRHRERALRVIEDLRSYEGHYVLQSFDARIVSHLKREQASAAVGLIVGRYKDPSTPKGLRRRLEEYWLMEAALTSTTPDFIAHDIKRLTEPLSVKIRQKRKLPLITWTIDSEEKRQKASELADNFIFEKLSPPLGKR